MKKIILISILCFLVQLANAQRWSTTFGTHNHYDEVYDLLEDYDKGHYIVGWDAIANGNGKGWDIKTNINGELLYDKRLVYTGVRVGVAGCQDSLGNKYIAGIDFGEIAWPFLIKFNPCGEKIWCSLLKHWDFLLGSPSDIIINDDGNILILTRFEDGGQQINQIFLLCYSPDGDLLWSKPYASKTEHPLINFAYGTKLYRFGKDYIISGYCYYPYPDNPNHAWLRPLFIGIDSQFNEKWVVPFGVADSVVGEAYSAIPLNDSVIMGVGSKFLDYSNGYIRNSLLMFVNFEGDELGFKRIWGDSIIPGTMDNLMVEIETVNDSIFLATAVVGPLSTGNPFGEIVFDTSGHVYNAEIRPNTRGISHMIKTFDNKYVIACTVNENDMNHTDIYMYKINDNLEQDTLYTQNFVYDSLCPDTIVSGDIDMTNCSVVQVSIGEAPTPEDYYKDLNTIPVKVYPNPSEDCISFDYKNTDRHQNIHLNCYDINGQKIYSENISTGQQGSKINISKWGSGVYMAIISSEGRIVGKAKFVVR
ncbi:MAG: T9SS type A sorting domain-containing protein [Bacteroidales bacterium]|nr:T9SS type A sorting domain-containing protein [Bacteroidales bacterium]